MSSYRTAEESRRAGIAYHLVPVDVWDRQANGPAYAPEAFDEDGFIHLTNGLDPLLQVANMFYATDPRDFAVLVLAVPEIASPVRYDDPEEQFPHIYGPLNVSAVRDRLAVDRGPDGTFLAVGNGVG